MRHEEYMAFKGTGREDSEFPAYLFHHLMLAFVNAFGLIRNDLTDSGVFNINGVTVRVGVIGESHTEIGVKAVISELEGDVERQVAQANEIFQRDVLIGQLVEKVKDHLRTMKAMNVEGAEPSALAVAIAETKDKPINDRVRGKKAKADKVADSDPASAPALDSADGEIPEVQEEADPKLEDAATAKNPLPASLEPTVETASPSEP